MAAFQDRIKPDVPSGAHFDGRIRSTEPRRASTARAHAHPRQSSHHRDRHVLRLRALRAHIRPRTSRLPRSRRRPSSRGCPLVRRGHRRRRCRQVLQVPGPRQRFRARGQQGQLGDQALLRALRAAVRSQLWHRRRRRHLRDAPGLRAGRRGLLHAHVQLRRHRARDVRQRHQVPR